MTPEEQAIEYAEKIHPFKPALNGKGEEIEQRVGQRPYGIKKWEKQIEVIVKDWLEGYNSRQQEIDGLKARLELYWSKGDDNFNDIVKLRSENERLKAELETAKHLNNVFRERLYKNSSLNDLDDGSMKDAKFVKSNKYQDNADLRSPTDIAKSIAIKASSKNPFEQTEIENLKAELEQSAKIAEKWSNKYANTKAELDKAKERFDLLLHANEMGWYYTGNEQWEHTDMGVCKSLDALLSFYNPTEE